LLKIIFGLFLLFGLANFVCSVLILRRLAAADIKVSFFEIRWQVHKHLPTYRRLTEAATGRVGLAYFGYWGSLAGLATTGVALLLLIGE